MSYPDESQLLKIKNWQANNSNECRELMGFVKSLWWNPFSGWTESEGTDEHDKPVDVYEISTGGWSGNEELIEAMIGNWLFWNLCWVETRRGGHYIFYVNK